MIGLTVVCLVLLLVPFANISNMVGRSWNINGSYLLFLSYAWMW